MGFFDKPKAKTFAGKALATLIPAIGLTRKIGHGIKKDIDKGKAIKAEIESAPDKMELYQTPEELKELGAIARMESRVGLSGGALRTLGDRAAQSQLAGLRSIGQSGGGKLAGLSRIQAGAEGSAREIGLLDEQARQRNLQGFKESLSMLGQEKGKEFASRQQKDALKLELAVDKQRMRKKTAQGIIGGVASLGSAAMGTSGLFKT
jgi:hypothetical protein